MSTFLIRPADERDLPFLRLALYEAAYWRPAERPPIDEGLHHPELAKLLEGWGRAGDTAVIAEANGAGNVGAAWFRLWTDDTHSFGCVDAETPELGIGVMADKRRRGAAYALMRELIESARSQGFRRLSLSVEAENRPAVRLYQKLGFRPVGVCGRSWTMLLDLGNAPPGSGASE